MRDNDTPDATMMPFHIWANADMHDARDRASALREMMKGLEHGSLEQIFCNNIGWLMSSYATLLNVMATEAASRYEADVKGRADGQRARPPANTEYDGKPWLAMFVFQTAGDLPFQQFAFGKTEADARARGSIAADVACIGWH